MDEENPTDICLSGHLSESSDIGLQDLKDRSQQGISEIGFMHRSASMEEITCGQVMSDMTRIEIVSHTAESRAHRVTSPYVLSISSRRGIDLSIPRFNQLSSVHRSMSHLPASTRSHVRDSSGLFGGRRSKHELISTQDHRQQLLRSHSLGPLTPPHDVEIRSWSQETLCRSPIEAEHDSADQASSTERTQAAGPDSSISQAPEAQQKSVITTLSQESSPSTWLEQALRKIGRRFGSQPGPQYVEFVSQVLPNHATDRRLVKTSETVCDHLQQTLRDLQGVTITHAIAVPQTQVVEDFPKSPPTTPNFVVANGYFDEPIIVTKAANVPIYHNYSGQVSDLGAHVQRRIMVRPIVDIALVERCIPPTAASETTDFFDADSYRSYLADRLSELAVGGGSLLLIYPTKKGGQTFARKYVSPILDPLLREMSILRGLDTNAAQKLGSMTAIDSMLEFGEMKNKVEELCTSMSRKSRASLVRSSYELVHCQTVDIILDKATWMTWYVEQEQQRMKQNLVDYHKDGGRLPQGDGGSSELTAGMLTREIIEGLHKSRNVSGDVGIELGVFMIQRMSIPR